MGGGLKPINLEEGTFELVVPRIQLFDIWLQPSAMALVLAEDAGKLNALTVFLYFFITCSSHSKPHTFTAIFLQHQSTQIWSNAGLARDS